MSTVVPYTALTGDYAIEPAHSTIGFSVRHAVIGNVCGRFAAFEGLLKLNRYQLSGSGAAYLSVQAASIDTNSPDRDARLAGPDFLDAATYPLLLFRSASLVDRGNGQFRLTGHLRIKDAELPLHIHLAFDGATQDEGGGHRVGFSGTALVRRSDWGLGLKTSDGTGGILISDKLRLTFEVSAVRLPDSDAV